MNYSKFSKTFIFYPNKDFNDPVNQFIVFNDKEYVLSYYRELNKETFSFNMLYKLNEKCTEWLKGYNK